MSSLDLAAELAGHAGDANSASELLRCCALLCKKLPTPHRASMLKKVSRTAFVVASLAQGNAPLFLWGCELLEGYMADDLSIAKLIVKRSQCMVKVSKI
jgi:hypothetical protein